MARMTKEQRAAKAAERKASEERMAAAKAVAAEIVRGGVCPNCGTKLQANMSILGWYQCGALGSVAMRKPEYRDLPACSFQCFV